MWHLQEEERRRLARELHDGIGQNLTAIVRMISHALSEFPSGKGAPPAGFEKARDLAESTLIETRALSRQLRPQILDDLGLPAALRWLARTLTTIMHLRFAWISSNRRCRWKVTLRPSSSASCRKV